MSPDQFGFPTINELYGGSTRGKRNKNMEQKYTKKKFTLTTATRKLICNEVGRCENCGDKKSLEIHHIKKVSEGGAHTPSNIIVLCHDCHKNKAHRGSLSSAEQRKKVRNRSTKLKEGIKVILSKAKKRQEKTKRGNKKTKAKSKANNSRQKSPFDIPVYRPPRF